VHVLEPKLIITIMHGQQHIKIHFFCSLNNVVSNHGLFCTGVRVSVMFLLPCRWQCTFVQVGIHTNSWAQY